MEDLAENFLHLAGAQLGHGTIQGASAAKRRMGSRQESPCIRAVAPDMLGIRNYSCDSLRPLAFGCAQPVAAALEGGFRNDPVHELFLFHPASEDPAGGLP